LTTASPFDAAIRGALDRLHAATTELARLDRLPELGEQAVDLVLGLTGSSHAVLALDGGSGEAESIFWRTTDRSRRLDSDATELLGAAGLAGSRVRPTEYNGHPCIGAELRAGGGVVGRMAVARPSDYSETDRHLFAIFGSHVAQTLKAAILHRRERLLETTLLGLRARVDSDEETRSRTEERLRGAERVERAHELAVEVLLAVSAHAGAGQSLPDFYRRLAKTVAELVGAGKVLFWRLDENQMLAPGGGFGINASFVANLTPIRCEPSGDNLGSRVVYKDLIFRANRKDESTEFGNVLERLGVESAISVPWRAGEERLGLVAAYDSSRPGGFSREDTWVLQKAGLAAGLVTQLWHAQEDLRKSVDRLTKVDSARQMLLKNMTTVVEKERKRFVSELHDDALQKLTAAELHLGRLHPGGEIEASSLANVRGLLEQTENSLRRLVFEVRPPALESRDGLVQSIQDRIDMLAGSGIRAEVDVDLPDDLSPDVRSMIFRQVADAIGNVERHAKATLMKLTLKLADGGIHGVVEDDGQGFVVAERSNLPGHLGLLALRERALMAGGWYKIESQPGAGTQIEFWIPRGPVKESA
jgi:signal transduction histidine kinase